MTLGSTNKTSRLNTGKRPGGGLHVVSVTSGKGGVGKTLTTVNLAIGAASLGRRVLVLDGDLGMANIDVVLGLNPQNNISDVIDGFVSLNDIILKAPQGFDIIPTGSGITRLTKLSYIQKIRLIDEVANLETTYDTLIIDTGAGIAETVLHLNGIADETIVVTTPEPHAMTDAYAMIKVMNEVHPARGDCRLMVNMAHSQVEADRVHQRIAGVCKQFLEIDIDYLGYVPMDPQVPRQVAMRQAASAQGAHTVSGQAWRRVAAKIFGDRYVGDRDQQAVWRELVWQQQTQQFG